MKKLIIVVVVAVLLIASIFIYTRPLYLDEIFDIDTSELNCIRGYSNTEYAEYENVTFEYDSDKELIERFLSHKYRRSLINLFDNNKNQMENVADCYINWEFVLSNDSERVEIKNYNGIFYLSFHGKIVKCIMTDSDKALEEDISAALLKDIQ